MVRLIERARRRPDERGVVAVVVAITSVMLFTIAALVVNLGQARDTRRMAQNAADAAALAAANALYPAGASTPDIASAVAAVKQYALSNYNVSASDWSGCTDAAPMPYQPDPSSCISFDSATATTEVRVVMPVRNVATPLAAVIGITHAPVSALAQAKLVPGDKAACGLCVIGAGSHDIQNGDITVNGAGVFFNGTVTANPQGSVTVTNGQIALAGTTPSKGTFSPAPLEHQASINDPLAFLSLPPSFAGLTSKTSACGPGSGNGPGIYSQLNFTASCTLQPGLYVVTGTNHYSGATDVTANGVTLYFTCATGGTPRACNTGESGGDILMTGNASLTITAPTSGPTMGLSIISDRNNTATLGFRGNGVGASSGTIYAASGTLDYRGNGNGPALDSLVVVKDLTFSGNNAAFNSLYTKEKNAGMPPSKPFLSK